MNATRIEPAQRSVSMAAATHGNTPQPLKVFVAFDEDDCARNAEVLVHRVAPDELYNTELCRLEQLAALPQGNAVVCSASKADLFIIALRGGSTLAQPVRTWLSRLLTLRDNDQEGGLVVLLSGANTQPGANTELLAYLESLAVLSRLEFFAGRADSKATAYAELAPSPPTNFAPFTATIHAPVSLRGWGINE
jgi:hypothetical protein